MTGRAVGLRAQSRDRLHDGCMCGAVWPKELGNLSGGFSPLPQGNNHRPTSYDLTKTNPWRSAREVPASRNPALAGLGMGQVSLCRERVPGPGALQRW